MNAEDVAVGMAAEARCTNGWHPVRVRRRLDGGDYGFFEVQFTGSTVVARRFAEELRDAVGVCQLVRVAATDAHIRPRFEYKCPIYGTRFRTAGVGRIFAADGGSVAVWRPTDGMVAVEVEVPVGPPFAVAIIQQGILIPADAAARMARGLRAGTDFRFGDGSAAIWTAPSHSGFGTPAAKGTTWPDDGQPAVLVGPRAAALLAELIESAAAPDIEAGLRAAFGVRSLFGWGAPDDPPPDADPLAGARRRTDENLRKAFGG